MAVVIAIYDGFTLRLADGRMYIAQACGREREDRRWEGWLEFVPTDGSLILRSQRETTQRNRADLEYWASGLTAVYLQGALERTLTPPVSVAAAPPDIPAVYDEPAPTSPVVPTIPADKAALDPFAVYVQDGEEVLALALASLSPAELKAIILAFDLGTASPDLDFDTMSVAELVGWIVGAVRGRLYR